MIFQPRGYKRQPTYANLVLEIRRELDAIAAEYNVSRAFVITTLLARQLHLAKGEETDYEKCGANSERSARHRHHPQIRRVK
jgi:7,8-dihydro-6-hydroxymethylpterin-pyrophosphokinase